MRIFNLRKTLMTALLAAIACLWGPAAFSAAQGAPAETQTITINAQAPAHPFPHYWEQMFGSGHAILSLRSSYRRDLKAVKRATGFHYIRFHGIFDHEVGVYSENAQGQPDYNFSYVDQIYDGLLKNGVRPFVELDFMPRDLAANPARETFWYHPYVAPPKDWNRWGDLVRRFARHLVARYGIDEVSQWYFEVWNEPNLGFWAGVPKQSTYFHLYDVAARALKSVSPRLRVGGPATAQTAWVGAFIRHCAQGHVPVDFVSTHVYGNDSAEHVFGTHQRISRRDMVALAIKKVHREVAESAMPNLPLIFSEYNASSGNHVDVTDSAFMGPWLAQTISRVDGLVKILAYWDFSDVFEEGGVVKKPFYGGYGLIATGGIRKAAFNDFALLHRLGRERLAAKSGPVIVTRRSDGTLVIALWNYAPAHSAGSSKIYKLSFEGLSGGHRAIIWTVDSHHGSPLDTWRAMGSPRFPSFEQEKILHQAAQLPGPVIRDIPVGRAELSVKLAPHALSLIEVAK